MAEDLYASMFPLILGFLGIVLMIVGPSVMVWKLKQSISENANWIMYAMVMFIIGLGLFIYLLAG